MRMSRMAMIITLPPVSASSWLQRVLIWSWSTFCILHSGKLEKCQTLRYKHNNIHRLKPKHTHQQMHSYVLKRTQRHLSSKIYSNSLLTILSHINWFLFVPNTYPKAYTYILTHIHVSSSHIYPYALCKLNLTSERELTSCKAPRSLFHILDIFRNDHNRWLCKSIAKTFHKSWPNFNFRISIKH